MREWEMDDIQLKIEGKQGTGKSVLLSLIGAMLQKNSIPYTLIEDKHLMKINMNDFIKHKGK